MIFATKMTFDSCEKNIPIFPKNKRIVINSEVVSMNDFLTLYELFIFFYWKKISSIGNL